MSDEAISRIKNNFPKLTPEMFGAVGDGVHDDTQAIQMMSDVYDTLNWAIRKAERDGYER